jgi:hypothetical protein
MAEKENPDSRMLNVFNISPENKDILKKEVEKWDGFVHIFVHPYYRYGAEGRNNYYLNESDNKPEDSSEELWEFLKTILAEEPRYPVFLFEERWKEFDGIINAIVAQINHGNTYLVPTWSGSPTPFIENQPIPQSQEDVDKNRDDAWKKIKHFFQEIGVKSIYVDGCYLDKVKEPVSDDALKNLRNCVGATLQNLSSNGEFEIKLGSHTFGLKRDDLVGLGVDEILPSHLQTKEDAENKG